MYALVKPGESSSSRQRNILQQNEIKKEPIQNPGDFSQLSESDEDSVSEIVSKYLAKRNIKVSFLFFLKKKTMFNLTYALLFNISS